jgi:hypothetical protein
MHLPFKKLHVLGVEYSVLLFFLFYYPVFLFRKIGILKARSVM